MNDSPDRIWLDSDKRVGGIFCLDMMVYISDDMEAEGCLGDLDEFSRRQDQIIYDVTHGSACPFLARCPRGQCATRSNKTFRHQVPRQKDFTEINPERRFFPMSPHILSTEKGGYYPFSDQYLPAVASLFNSPAGRGRILDPCAGEGAALEELARRLKLSPHANELDEERAAKCRERFGLTQAVQGDLMTLRTSHNAYILNWVNPPYTANRTGDEKRREFEHLKHAWQWTKPGAYTVWVVYNIHMTERAARWLLSHTSRLDVYRVPGKHLNKYAQILVVARKAYDLQEVDGQAVLDLVKSCQSPDDLPLLKEQAEPLYQLPDSPKIRRFVFRPDEIKPETMLAAIQQQGAHQSRAFHLLTAPPAADPPLTSVIKPRGGQIGMILAAGLFDGLVLNLEKGPAAVRGVVRMIEVDTTPPGMEGVRETTEIRPQVTITLLHKDGQVTRIMGEDEAALTQFLKEHRQAFLEYFDQNSTILYDFDYGHLEEAFDRVFRNRRLPGRPGTGLFETQKHVAAAAYATLMTRKGVLLAGEMGVGKSAIGAATAGALHANGHLKPGQIALVMCPPHLTHKWQREVEDAIPGCQAHIATDVDDTTTFMALAAAHPARLHVLIVSRERAKLAEGWEPAYRVHKEYVARWPRGSEAPPELKGQPRVVTQEILCCPACGQPISKRKDGSEAASRNWLKKQPRTCTNHLPDSGEPCDSPLWQFKRIWSKGEPGPVNLRPTPKRDPAAYAARGEYYSPKWLNPPQLPFYGADRQRPKRNPRYPLASLLRERYPGRIGIALIDEIHETKSGSSDQGRAMQNLVLAADRVIGMTGTLFGGVASSLFWLEWAFNPRMVDHYPLTDGRGPAVNQFVRDNGVLERVIEYKEDTSESGSYSGIRRIEHLPKEVPGISPRLVASLIDHTLWVGLRDLNFALPDYQEIPVEAALPPEVQEAYDSATQRLIKYLLERKKEGDASFLSTYLQATLRYPSSCFRAKPVIHRLKERDEQGQPIQRHVLTMKGFGEEAIYPKEAELLSLIEQELAEGRRCVVFVAQTNTLDIQPRLEKLIQTIPGAKPFILRQKSPKTDQRDSHVEKQVKKGYNVMIANPILVMTGIDLIAFPTIIFYETNYSLYVTSQASRRAWRIGQTLACKVFYLYYGNTMEARAIDLISKKQAAASLLSGDALGGGLAQLSGGSNSLLAELAKTIAEDNQVVDATRLFKREAEQSDDFTSGWAANMAEKARQRPQPAEAPAAPEPPADKPPQQLAAQSPFQACQAIKRQYPQILVLIEEGVNYQAYGDDAKTLADLLSIPLVRRKEAGEIIPLCGIPAAQVEAAIAQINAAGHQVALGRHKAPVRPAKQAVRPRKAPLTKAARPAPPQSKQPHGDLTGQTFIDPEDRELTVVGPDPLFPDTHVQVRREGKRYSIPVEKVRTYTPFDGMSGHQAAAGGGEDDYWAERADEHEANLPQTLEETLSSYHRAKAQHPDKLVVACSKAIDDQVNPAYLAFGEDAQTASEALPALISHWQNDGKLTGYVNLSIEQIDQLREAGHTIAIQNGNLRVLEATGSKPPTDGVRVKDLPNGLQVQTGMVVPNAAPAPRKQANGQLTLL